ncbi:MAG: serine/threonine-protein kinase [Pseudomonadota bacterium]
MERIGRYRVIRTLGEGAWGRVVEAVQEGPRGFRKRVALKILPSGRDGERAAFAEALAREARLGALVHHPNVAEIFDLGEERGRLFLAMELVEGVTLADLVEAARRRGRGLPLGLVLHLARQVCAGLAEIHGATGLDGQPLHLVHRDVKPSNLMVDRRGTVKILDFGIARARVGTVTPTAGEELRGTLRYLSPEQVSAPGEVTARADLFALGAVLFDLATGEQLFDGPSEGAVLHAVLHEPFDRRRPAMGRLCPALAPLLARLLEKDPAARPADAKVVAEEIDRLAASQPAGSDPLSELRSLWPRVSRTRAPEEPEGHRVARRWGPALVMGGVLLLAGLGIAFVIHHRGEAGEAGVPEAAAPAAEVLPTVPRPAVALTSAPTAEDLPTALPPVRVPASAPAVAPRPAPAGPAHAHLRVSFEPPWADVWLDDGAVAEDADSPVLITATPGPHRLRVQCRAPSCSQLPPVVYMIDVAAGEELVLPLLNLTTGGGASANEGERPASSSSSTATGG